MPDFLDRTRAAYDAMAEDYAAQFRTELAAKPWARAFLGVFAQLVHAGGGGTVLDIGCGTGVVTGHLASLGLHLHGIDLSPGMLDVARRQVPGARFDVGSMTDLTVPRGHYAGIVAWYSIVHVPVAERRAVFTAFARAMEPGGHLVLAFQVRDTARHLDSALGHDVDLTYYPVNLAETEAALAAAGLRTQVRLVREADDEERTPHAHLLARRDAS